MHGGRAAARASDHPHPSPAGPSGGALFSRSPTFPRSQVCDTSRILHRARNDAKPTYVAEKTARISLRNPIRIEAGTTNGRCLSIRTPLAGSDGARCSISAAVSQFQSALPLRGVTAHDAATSQWCTISTRTPLAGSDRNILWQKNFPVNMGCLAFPLGKASSLRSLSRQAVFRLFRREPPSWGMCAPRSRQGLTAPRSLRLRRSASRQHALSSPDSRCQGNRTAGCPCRDR